MKVCAKCGNPYHGYDVCENCGSLEFKEIGGAHRNNGVVLDGSVINNTANSAQNGWGVHQGAEAGAYNNAQQGAYNNVMPNNQYNNIGNAENNVNANMPRQNSENNVAGVNAPQVGSNAGAIAKEKAPISQKTVIITAVVAFVLALLLAVAGWFIYTSEVNKIELITDTVTVEYGETVHASDYVEFNDIFTAKNTKIGWDLIETDEVTDEETGETTDVPAVGEHEIVIRHDVKYSIFGHVIYSTTKEETATLVVKDVSTGEDTTGPVFADDTPTTYTNVYIDDDCLKDYYESYVTADSDVTFTIDYEGVYISDDGDLFEPDTIIFYLDYKGEKLPVYGAEYERILYATDEDGNTSTLPITIQIQDYHG